jgi:hypothetical protein
MNKIHILIKRGMNIMKLKDGSSLEIGTKIDLDGEIFTISKLGGVRMKPNPPHNFKQIVYDENNNEKILD